MDVKEVSTSNLEEIIRDGIVLIDWWASWCGPCRAFAPVFEATASKYPEIRFAKADTEAQGSLAAAFQIRAIPTLMVFRDGILLHRQAGARPARALDELIGRIRALDMDDVRKRNAEAQRQERSQAAAP